MRLIPRYLVVLGIAVAICGELSWLYLMFQSALPERAASGSADMIPGFVWTIVIGVIVPASLERSSSGSVRK
jgi:Na+/glutamate symporter